MSDHNEVFGSTTVHSEMIARDLLSGSFVKIKPSREWLNQSVFMDECKACPSRELANMSCSAIRENKAVCAKHSKFTVYDFWI